MTVATRSDATRLATSLLVVAATSVSAGSGLFAIAGASPTAAAMGRPNAFALLVTAHQATSGIGIVLGGALVDRWGLGRTFKAGCVLAALAAFTLAVATDLPLAVLLRALAGLGAGICQAVAVAVVPLLGAQRDRARLFAVSSSVWGIGGIVIPGAVAFAVAAAGWRAAPLLEGGQALLALVAFALALARVPSLPQRSGARVDVPGLVLLLGVASTVQLLLGAPALALVAAPSALALGWLFWWWTGRRPEPLLSHSQLVGRALLPCHLVGIVSFVGAWGVHAALPVVVEEGLGARVGVGALALTLSSVGWVVSAAVSPGMQRRTSARRTALTGLVVQAGLLAAGAAGLSVSVAGVLVLATAVGAAGGLITNSAVVLASAALSADGAGRGLAGFQLLRNLGAGVGSALVGLLISALGPLAGFRVAQLGAAVLTLLAVLALRGLDEQAGAPTIAVEPAGGGQP